MSLAEITPWDFSKTVIKLTRVIVNIIIMMLYFICDTLSMLVWFFFCLEKWSNLNKV